MRKIQGTLTESRSLYIDNQDRLLPRGSKITVELPPTPEEIVGRLKALVASAPSLILNLATRECYGELAEILRQVEEMNP